MPLAQKGTLSSNITRMAVCVDSYDGREFEGSLCSPFLPEPVRFGDILELLNSMEHFFDSVTFPQQAFTPRTFRNPPAERTRDNPQEARRYMDDLKLLEQTGEKSTFIVQVQFRQNATWQGIIQWTDKKQTKKFRSTLELIKLMDDALSETAPQPDENAAQW